MRPQRRPRFRSAISPVLVYLTAVVTLVVASAVAIRLGEHPGLLLRDPQVESEAPLWTGALSLVGSVLWAAAAGACLVTGLMLRRHPDWHSWTRFFVVAGVVNTCLCLDDTFLIHDHLLPALGVPDLATYVLYGLLGAAWVGVCRAQFLVVAREPLLLTSVALLVVSVIIDVGLPFSYTNVVIEDAPKYLGIFGWAGAWFRISSRWPELASNSHDVSVQVVAGGSQGVPSKA